MEAGRESYLVATTSYLHEELFAFQVDVSNVVFWEWMFHWYNGVRMQSVDQMLVNDIRIVIVNSEDGVYCSRPSVVCR